MSEVDKTSKVLNDENYKYYGVEGNSGDFSKEEVEQWQPRKGSVPSGDCPSCLREGRVYTCTNGLNRCLKCDWVVELNDYSPIRF